MHALAHQCIETGSSIVFASGAHCIAQHGDLQTLGQRGDRSLVNADGSLDAAQENVRDVALIANLRLHGTLKGMLGKAGPWQNRKGFHRKDASVLDPVSTKPLHKMRYLDAKRFHVTGPVLDGGLLDPFPVASTPTATKFGREAGKSGKISFGEGLTKGG